MFEKSRIYEILRDTGVIDVSRVELYAPCVRDRDDVKAYRCERSGVIFLDRTDHIGAQHYIEKDLSDWSFAVGEKQVQFVELDNAERQMKRFGHLVEGKSWLDFGCGGADLLGLLGDKAKEAWGVEPTRWYADPARAKGLNIASSLEEFGDKRFDIITLFHVFEHLQEPLDVAVNLRERLNPGGILLLEVPHARDFLLDQLDSDEFRSFTLWSEHLVLHTRDSLTAMLKAAGFLDVDVTGVQRFPLSNHLYWLRHGKPGGHKIWASVDDPALTKAYEEALARNNATDTLVAIAKK